MDPLLIGLKFNTNPQLNNNNSILYIKGVKPSRDFSHYFEAPQTEVCIPCFCFFFFFFLLLSKPSFLIFISFVSFLFFTLFTSPAACTPPVVGLTAVIWWLAGSCRRRRGWVRKDSGLSKTTSERERKRCAKRLF